MKSIDLKSFILHLFKIHLDSCLVININHLYWYIEHCRCFGYKTKTDIRNIILQLHHENLIKNCVVVTNNEFIIYK